MLILIAGITGNLGRHLAIAALADGHAVRGLGRTPNKLPEEISSKLESFVKSEAYDDITALNKACESVDAVICAYNPSPLLNLDGQLLLLRAAERAGVKRFHASSWNADWSKSSLGDVETYDSFISFFYQARLTSPIKPLYMFVGFLAKTFFAVPGAGAFESDSSLWVRKSGRDRQINVIGTGDEPLAWTSEADAAAFSVALVTSDVAEQGGFYRFCSEEITLKDLQAAYLEVYPDANIEWSPIPFSLQQIEGVLQSKRNEAIAQGKLRERYKEYLSYAYIVCVNGPGRIENLDTDKFTHVKKTKLVDYIREMAYEV